MSSDRYANCVTPTAPSFQLCSTYKVSGQSYKTTKARWVLQPVWPDAEIKSSPIFLQKMPKMLPTQFLLEKWYCQNNPIDIIHVGVLYNKKNHPEIYKNRPMWSHWLPPPLPPMNSLASRHPPIGANCPNDPNKKSNQARSTFQTFQWNMFQLNRWNDWLIFRFKTKSNGLIQRKTKRLSRWVKICKLKMVLVGVKVPRLR